MRSSPPQSGKTTSSSSRTRRTKRTKSRKEGKTLRDTSSSQGRTSVAEQELAAHGGRKATGNNQKRKAHGRADHGGSRKMADHGGSVKMERAGLGTEVKDESEARFCKLNSHLFR